MVAYSLNVIKTIFHHHLHYKVNSYSTSRMKKFAKYHLTPAIEQGAERQSCKERKSQSQEVSARGGPI
jgi:hypothetical protein